MKILQGFFIAALIILVVGYYYHLGTPEYALGEIKTALEERDKKLFDEYVDVESIKLGVIQEYLEQREVSVEAEMKVTTALNTFSEMIIASYFAPQFVRNKMNNSASVGIDDVQNKNCTSSRCTLTVIIRHKVKKTTRNLDVEMRKSSGEWRLVRVKGLAGEIKKVLRL